MKRSPACSVVIALTKPARVLSLVSTCELVCGYWVGKVGFLQVRRFLSGGSTETPLLDTDQGVRPNIIVKDVNFHAYMFVYRYVRHVRECLGVDLHPLL